MSRQDYKKWISYDEKTNISQCMVPECHTVFIGKKMINVKRHYEIAHFTDIEENETNGDMLNINDPNNHNNINRGEGNPFASYRLECINDSASKKKSYKSLLAAYVEYCRQTNVSKCLIKTCERPLSGRRTGNIKRHYHKVHNFIIVYDNQETIRKIDKELSEYYNNDDTFGDSMFNDENEDEITDASEHNRNAKINWDQYIEYDALINKSLCKIPGCRIYLEGRKLTSIKRHYATAHGYDIDSNGLKVYRPKHFKYRYGSFNISVDNLVVYDKNSSSYQCLFINCNQILEKHLPTLKKHYHKTHKIIIAKYLDNIPNRLYRQRNRKRRNTSQDSEFPKEDDDCEDKKESCFVRNELLIDDEYPHCSKRHCSNDESDIKETESNSDRKEIIIEENSSKIEITMTKIEFLKLCLNLVIEHDLKVHIFDDDKLFKKLLTPFEESFGCKLNSIVMKDLTTKANNAVVNALTQKFANKIVCLELHVVNFENEYYLIFNVRFLNEQILCNAIVGFLPITETETDILQIFEYLSKFNIDKQQVYMITILSGCLDNEKINSFCNNLCKNNTDIKKHPVCYIQTVFRSFVHEYSEDIKNWQALVNYDSKSNADEFNKLKEFANYLENLPKTDIVLEYQLQKASSFCKSLQILSNFIDKLSEEQYVAGDFYRDLLCCELELKSEQTKHNNTYAAKLYDELTEYKTTLLESNEFMGALYLDARFNFLSSRLLNDDQKEKGKLFLCSVWKRFKTYIENGNGNLDSLHIDTNTSEESEDDEYALLNQHINDIQVKCGVCIEDIITNSIPTKREPFNLEILKYWQANGKDMEVINGLSKIAFTFSCSQYVSIYLEKNFAISHEGIDKLEKFLIKSNPDILEENVDLVFKDLK